MIWCAFSTLSPLLLAKLPVFLELKRTALSAGCVILVQPDVAAFVSDLQASRQGSWGKIRLDLSCARFHNTAHGEHWAEDLSRLASSLAAQAN